MPRLVELYQFPGFSKDGPMPLPHHTPFSTVVAHVVRAQHRLSHKVPAYSYHISLPLVPWNSSSCQFFLNSSCPVGYTHSSHTCLCVCGTVKSSSCCSLYLHSPDIKPLFKATFLLSWWSTLSLTCFGGCFFRTSRWVTYFFACHRSSKQTNILFIL